MTITIKRIGGNLTIIIPDVLARKMELTEGTTLNITANTGALVMKKRGPLWSRRSLAEIVAQIKSENYRCARSRMVQHSPSR